jgi:hypothetical protein
MYGLPTPCKSLVFLAENLLNFTVTTSVAVMRRSRSRAGVLVLLPHLLSTSYLSKRKKKEQQHNRTIHN